MGVEGLIYCSLMVALFSKAMATGFEGRRREAEEDEAVSPTKIEFWTTTLDFGIHYKAGSISFVLLFPYYIIQNASSH